MLLSRRRLWLHRQRRGHPPGGGSTGVKWSRSSVSAASARWRAPGFLQGTQLLAGQFADPAEVAYLVAAVALIAPLYFLPRALALALFPAMAGAHGAGRRRGRTPAGGRRHTRPGGDDDPGVPAGLLVAPVVLVLLGGRCAYAEGAPVLRLMLCASFFGILQVPSVNALASGSPAQAPHTGRLRGAGLSCRSRPGVADGPADGDGRGDYRLSGRHGGHRHDPGSRGRRIHRLTWAPALLRCVVLLALGGLVAQLESHAGLVVGRPARSARVCCASLSWCCTTISAGCSRSVRARSGQHPVR